VSLRGGVPRWLALARCGLLACGAAHRLRARGELGSGGVVDADVAVPARSAPRRASPGGKLRRAAGHYCGARCAKDGWRTHKALCAAMTAAREQRRSGGGGGGSAN
jgi:hypothetical protein